MGAPIICQDCRVSNGLLAEECRGCGVAVSRTRTISRVEVPGQAIPSAAWETRPIPEIWRQAAPITPTPETVSAHDFLRYALLLRAMRDRFEQEDGIIWFDDALFFLRGGYDFFCYLNLSSGLTMRGRIFGGLNHAAAPAQKLTSWFSRFVDEARARGAATVDVFLAEEINSGSSAHRTMNVIQDAMSHANPTGSPLTVNFWYYLACTDGAVFDIQRFQKEVANKRHIQNDNLIVRNNFRLFQGPLLAYDEERYSGLRVTSKGHDAVESYQAIRHRATTFHLVCPTTGEEPFWCAPGENDLDNFAGVLILNLLGVGVKIPYNTMAQRVAAQSCAECKGLFAQLRSAGAVWPDRLL